MATTTNFGWETPDDTDLVKDGAAAIRTALGGVDTSFIDLKGGTTGQILSKASNTDLDYTWVTTDDANAIQNAIVDAKGDLITATAADTPARLAVGTNGQTLVADSSTATGLKWATASGGGKVLQVVSTYSTTSTSESAGTYTDYISASITPATTGSRILVLATIYNKTLADATGAGGTTFNIVRTATQVYENFRYINNVGNGGELREPIAMNFLDSPSTTSATTYKVQFKRFNATSTCGNQNYASSLTLLEIGA